ncbi:DUF4304 domain-containing protein [Pirellulaceae bacterium SH501]
MAEWAEQRRLMNEALKKIAVPVLRAQGFKGTLPHFRQVFDDHIRVIGFQFSQWGPSFYVELGVCGPDGTTFGEVHYHADRIKYYQSHARRRVGKLPFHYGAADTAEVARDVAIVLQHIEDDWNSSLEQWRSGPLRSNGSV